jgi:SecD/SecF fusion protein
MTDRRRNVFILLLVAGLLLASVAVIATKSTRLGLDLKGGVSLVYEAKPTRFSNVTGDAIQRSIDIMRERVDQLGVSEPEIQRSGENQIEVSLPDVKNADQAQSQVGTTAQLWFYDWEKSVVGKDGKPHPTDAQVTGGPAAGNPGAGSMSYYDAVTTASKFKPTAEPDDTTNGLFYGVDEGAKKVICGPQETAADLRDACSNEGKRPSKVIEVPRGYVIIQAEGAASGDKKEAATAADAYFILKDDPALRGTDIKNPEQNYDNGPGGSGQPNVTFDFTGPGAKKWQQVTREIAQRGQSQALPGVNAQDAAQHFAIVLDNQLISVPYIDYQRNPDGIDGRTGSEISGGFTIKSAQRLANLLKTGALPIRLELISQSQVSATLGKQALNQGLVAGLVGFAIVALFLLAFYRVLGLIAVGALLIYAVYFYALIKLIPITLTLPGIAGLILTIGVAADANIVIFERVKEEIRAGRSVAAGIAQGYKKGISAIIDANVVTFMVAFILFILATAGVKGFAFTLGIGTLTSLFTAVLATQAILGTMQRSRFISSPAMLGAGEQHHKIRLDFIGKSKWFFSASGVILLVCALALGGKGLNFGIDFQSGTRVKAAFAQQPSEKDVSAALRAAGFTNPEVQKVTGDRELGGNGDGVQISMGETGAKVAKVESVLAAKFGQPRAYQANSIGPTFGATVAKSAIIAIIASLIVISAYIALRFDWKYAVPVLIAVAHDILITSGVYALVGREVTTSTVAALLTILGFSLYDTIIVFDRIRENAPRMPRATFSQIVNRSMSEVIVRSLATSLCTMLPVFALLLFGGSTLKDFAFALLVGTASGAYSSVFIAAPVLVHWKEREETYRRRRSRILSETGEVPAYATAGHGVTIEPKGPSRPGRRLTTPDDPERGVSQREFDEMVRDIEHATEQSPVAAKTRTKRRPEPEPQAEPEAEPDPTADAAPEDLVLKDTPKRDRPKRSSRNKRHGRPR